MNFTSQSNETALLSGVPKTVSSKTTSELIGLSDEKVSTEGEKSSTTGNMNALEILACVVSK
jgi:hypothetical protein